MLLLASVSLTSVFISWIRSAPLANPEPPKQRTEIPIDPKLLDNYTGRYQLTPNSIFEITRDGDRLFAQGFAQRSSARPCPAKV